MTSNDFKIIWDAVHGQIKISSRLCRNILDTKYFQRLKRLEQTNSRPLYPCAHHDRFIHSLGTYHLGHLAYNAIVQNSEFELNNLAKKKNKPDIKWEQVKLEFELACLLHDVGHAPFSHTFEKYFNVDLEKNSNNLLDLLLTNRHYKHKIPNVRILKPSFDEFKKDYELAIKTATIDVKLCDGSTKSIKVGSNPKEHEKVSAFLVLSAFQDTIINSFSANPVNIARMILGVKFSEGIENADCIDKQVLNCFIELLNGEEIDVDKIDYLIRDQWATGNVFRKIDYQRLLNSIIITTDEQSGLLVNSFHKKAINEILAIKETKNNLSINIHSHPIVKYDDYLLRKAVNEVVIKELNSKEYLDLKRATSNSVSVSELEKNYVSKIVCIDALIKPTKFSVNKIFLPSDDDLVHFLKKHINNSPYAKEWLSREYRLKAIWKTPHDFNYHFSKLSDFERKVLYKKISPFTKKFTSTTSWDGASQLSKLYYIEKNVSGWKKNKDNSDLNIFISDDSNSTINLSELLQFDKKSNEKDDSTNSYFIVYLPSVYLDKKENEQRRKNRNSFVLFLIEELKKYLEDVKNEIISVLQENPNLTSFQILEKLPYVEKFGEDNKEEFFETLNMLLVRMQKESLIGSDDKNVKPKLRKYMVLLSFLS